MGRWRGYYDWDYYSESRPRKVEGGIKTKKERGAIGETWWSKRWVHVLEALGMGSRLARGRSYARKGQVLSIDIASGLVKAKVQGSLREPYKITIQLQPLSNQDWDKVTEVMSSQALFAAKLLAAEMPTNIEEAFGQVNLSLFPTTESDLHTKCSCPDWANPCKHIAAVYYILAERFDEDPFLLFTLRGRTKEEIINILRQKRAETVVPEDATTAQIEQSDDAGDEKRFRLEDYLETFWQAGETLNTFVVQPQNPRVENAVLKRLGAAPYSIDGKNVTSLLERAYAAIEEAVQRKTSEE